MPASPIAVAASSDASCEVVGDRRVVLVRSRCERGSQRTLAAAVASRRAAVRRPSLVKHACVLVSGRSRPPRSRSSSPPPGPCTGRRCRCSRSPRPRSRPASPPSARTGRGCTPPGRFPAGRARRASVMCSGLSRLASRPAKIAGCSVFTRPSSISGKPVSSRDVLHRQPGVGEGLLACRRWRSARRRIS